MTLNVFERATLGLEERSYKRLYEKTMQYLERRSKGGRDTRIKGACKKGQSRSVGSCMS